jgi:hypothetical protein
MSNSTALADGVLDYVVGRSGLLGGDASRTIRAWTVMPNAAGTGGTEVSGGSYAALTLSRTNHFNSDASSGSISNTGNIDFAEATASWGTVVGVTIHVTSGNALLRICRFATPVTVASGQTLRIPTGNLTLTQA